MNKISFTMIGGIVVGLITSCSGLPKNGPVEFSQAKEEIAKADDEEVEDIFPKTLERAQSTLDQSIELYEKAAEYKDPTAEGEKRKEAVRQAIEARNLAANARQAHREVNSWDSDIQAFTESKTISKKLDDVKGALQGAEAKISKELSENEQAPLNMTNTVAFFQTGKTELNAENRQRVREVAATLKNSPKLEAYVVGYADPRGSKQLNEKLAAARADAVVAELIDNGVRDSQIKIRPMGERMASASTTSGGQLQLERKVEIRIMPSSHQRSAE